jgi:hypothetical protein
VDPHVSPTIFIVPISNPSPSSTAAIDCVFVCLSPSTLSNENSYHSPFTFTHTHAHTHTHSLSLSRSLSPSPPVGGCAINQSPTVCVCTLKTMRRVYRFLSQILRIMDIPHNLATSNPLSYVCARDHIRVAVSMEGNDGPVVCKPKRHFF